jgi:methoxymalonate biosynthesis acyl carrier protein
MDERMKVRAFVSRHFQRIELQDDQDIFALGIVNSLFAMQLVLFIEKEFNLSLANEDLDIDNFRSLNAIMRLIQRKTAVA